VSVVTQQRGAQRPETAPVEGGGHGCPPVRQQLQMTYMIRTINL